MAESFLGGVLGKCFGEEAREEWKNRNWMSMKTWRVLLQKEEQKWPHDLHVSQEDSSTVPLLGVALPQELVW